MKIIISNKGIVDDLLSRSTPKITGFKKDKLFYILSRLYTGYSMDDADEGVSVCAERLKDVIGNNYNQYMRYLRDSKVVRIVKGYMVGERCMMYQLNTAYIGVPAWYEIQDYTLRKKLKALRNKETANQYPYLLKWMKGLKMDTAAASAWAENEREQKVLHPEFADVDSRNGRMIDPLRQYKHHRMFIEYFKIRYMRFKVDDKGSRLHTVLTQCSKKLRKFITYKGKQLVAIDLKNSQPYLLCCLLNGDFWRKKGDFKFSGPILSSLSLHIPSSFYSIMFPTSSESLASKDFQNYKMLAETGAIYEHFASSLKVSADGLELTRDEVKFRMMLCLYSKNKTKSRGMKTAFRKEFPAVYKLIKKIKEQDHRTLALLLQQIESHLILNVICKRIAKEKPNLPLFTIHDSIVTTIGNEEYVQQVIEKEMLKYVKVRPTVSTECWVPDGKATSLPSIGTVAIAA